MLREVITYTDYNDVERTEEFWFNFTKAEAMELELSTTGGLSATIDRIVAAKDIPTLIKLFKELVLKAYGEKSADGKRFIKVDNNGHRLADDFAQTEAYSILFMKLATDTDAASKFVNGIVPKDN